MEETCKVTAAAPPIEVHSIEGQLDALLQSIIELDDQIARLIIKLKPVLLPPCDAPCDPEAPYPHMCETAERIHTYVRRVNGQHETISNLINNLNIN